MNVGECKAIIKDLPDDTPIEINSVWDEDAQELTPSECDGFYHESQKKVFLTPTTIAL